MSATKTDEIAAKIVHLADKLPLTPGHRAETAHAHRAACQWKADQLVRYLKSLVDYMGRSVGYAIEAVDVPFQPDDHKDGYEQHFKRENAAKEKAQLDAVWKLPPGFFATLDYARRIDELILPHWWFGDLEHIYADAGAYYERGRIFKKKYEARRDEMDEIVKLFFNGLGQAPHSYRRPSR